MRQPTYCQQCDDFTNATRTDSDALRCTDCGAFTSPEPNVTCAKHEVRNSPYPSGQCPRCEQENQRRAMEQEMAQRRSNPRMHTSVDAPRW